MSMYDTARLLKTPGVSADVYISPSTISRRTKLGAQRMLRGGVYQGSWSSRTLQLAKLVRDTAKYPPFITSRRLSPGGSSTWYGGTVTLHNYNVSIEVATELVALLRADLAVYKINNPTEDSRYGYLANQLRYLEKWDATKTISAFNSQFTFWQDDFAMQAVDLVTATRTPAQIEQANALAAMLDSTERIYITNYNGE